MSMQKSGSPSSWLTCTDGIAAQWQDLLLLVARILFGWTFVMSGWRKLMDISGFVATMPNRGLPDFLGYIAPSWSSPAASWCSLASRLATHR